MKTRPLSRRFLAAALASCTLAAAAAFAAGPRDTISFDSAWHFYKGDAEGAQAATFNDASWKTVSVPNDWAIEGPFEANAPTRGSGAFAPSGVSWYRKSFTLPASDAGKYVAIVLDGVLANSDVYINGFDLGHRPYGYVALHYDLTGHLNPPGQANEIAVKSDTSAQPASRYYFGAGIVRHVRLVVTDPVHIDFDGTFVTTPRVTADMATVHVRTTVVNTSSKDRTVSLQMEVKDPAGHSVGTAESKPESIAAGKSADLDAEITVKKPELWDLDHPVMYSATADIRSDGKTLDDATVPFGVRTFEFQAATGFWLNGKNFKLKGVCLHADAAAFGLAVPEDEWIHRLEALKEYGANAVRTAHNPPSPEFLDACDKVGMLVMDEMFDCWTVAKNPQDYHLYFTKWNLIDTQDTVRRDRNHPSIILYSAGNEIHDTPRPEVAIPILKALVQTFHENDPTRPVTQALFRPNSDGNGGAYKNGLSDLLDVVGTNYRDAEVIKAHEEKPSIKIIGTEQGRGLPVWAEVRDHPAYAGDFIWTGVDYLGETFQFPNIGAGAGVLDDTDYPKAEALQRASWWCERPVVYMARSAPRGGGGRFGGRGRGAPAPTGPVDDNPDNPMQMTPPGATPAPGPGATGPSADGFVYAAAPGAAPPARGGRGGRGNRGRGNAAPGGGANNQGGGPGARPGLPEADWTPADLSPHPETVQVYSNCDQVELFLNGKSLGSKPRGAVDSVRTWDVEFAPGTLKAVASNGGKEVASNELTTAGPAAKLSLKADKKTLHNDFDSVSYVAVDVTDAKGTLVPTAKDHVTFSISGPGEIAAVENSQLVAQDFRAPEHDTYEGRAVVFVRATANSGKITLTASSPNLGKSSVSFDASPAAPSKP